MTAKNNNTRAQPRYLTIAFSPQELDWLHWVMTQVLTDESIKNSAKDKIIEAHELFSEAKAASKADRH